MRTLVCVWLTVLISAGCEGSAGQAGEMGAMGSPGAKGDPGDQGDKGDKGDKGDLGASGVWRDSSGTLIPNAVTFPGVTLAVVDANDHIWRGDPYLGQARFVTQMARDEYYTAASCGGTSYQLIAGSIAPLVTFEYVSGSGNIRAFPASGVAISNQNLLSYNPGTGCQAVTLTALVVQTSVVDALPNLTPPSLGAFNVPFHFARN